LGSQGYVPPKQKRRKEVGGKKARLQKKNLKKLGRYAGEWGETHQLQPENAGNPSELTSQGGSEN